MREPTKASAAVFNIYCDRCRGFIRTGVPMSVSGEDVHAAPTTCIAILGERVAELEKLTERLDKLEGTVEMMDMGTL